LPSFATCTGFQILSVDFPASNEKSLTTSQVAKQIGIQKEYEKSASNIRAGINVDNSDADRKITVLQGNATAESTRILNEAEAYIKDIQIKSQSAAYKKVAALTGQTANDTLMEYIYYANLYNVRNATLLVGV
jgi:regulator of protease activity HflC (stomatin/prohibitin superfamily)